MYKMHFVFVSGIRYHIHVLRGLVHTDICPGDTQVVPGGQPGTEHVQGGPGPP